MDFEPSKTVALSRRLDFRRYLCIRIGRLRSEYLFQRVEMAGRAAPIFMHFCKSREVGVKYFRKWTARDCIGWDAAMVRSQAVELGVDEDKMFDWAERQKFGFWNVNAVANKTGIIETFDSKKDIPQINFTWECKDLIPSRLPCWREDARDVSVDGVIPMAILNEFKEWLTTLYKNQERNENNRARQIRNIVKVTRIRDLRAGQTQAGRGGVRDAIGVCAGH